MKADSCLVCLAVVGIEDIWGPYQGHQFQEISRNPQTPTSSNIIWQAQPGLKACRQRAPAQIPRKANKPGGLPGRPHWGPKKAQKNCPAIRITLRRTTVADRLKMVKRFVDPCSPAQWSNESNVSYHSQPFWEGWLAVARLMYQLLYSKPQTNYLGHLGECQKEYIA